jgi:hypothetical protein
MEEIKPTSEDILTKNTGRKLIRSIAKKVALESFTPINSVQVSQTIALADQDTRKRILKEFDKNLSRSDLESLGFSVAVKQFLNQG